MTDDLYDRQHDLDLQIPNSVTIIGAGGVGSWTALNMALAGVQNLYIVDFDSIERHNLNRTPFKEEHIGMMKTTALVDLITERRIDAEVNPINQRIEEITDAFMDDLEDSVVIDCRDSADPLPGNLDGSVALTAGYDGMEYTIHTNPDFESLWGGGQDEYETVPSFIAPPQFIASIITAYVCSPDVEAGEEAMTTRSMAGTVNQIINGDGSE